MNFRPREPDATARTSGPPRVDFAPSPAPLPTAPAQWAPAPPAPTCGHCGAPSVPRSEACRFCGTATHASVRYPDGPPLDIGHFRLITA